MRSNSLELPEPGFYCRGMKRISIFMLVFSLCAGANLRAQDAATQERLAKLKGEVENLQDTDELHRKQIEALSREVQHLREQVGKPTGNYASQDALNDLSKKFQEKLQEIDNKRIEDNKRVAKLVADLEKALRTGSKPVKVTGNEKSSGGGDLDKGKESGGNSSASKDGYEHTVASGDTFSTIAQAYREKGVKVTADQIQKANPNVTPEKMKVGTVLFIPKPEK